MKLITFILGLVFCSAASAAPFCIVGNSGKFCYYHDWNQCLRDAERTDGDCVANVENAVGNSPYCAVSGSGADCTFYNKARCKDSAARHRGVCVINPNN